MKEIKEVITNNLSKKINSLLEEAVCKYLGLEQVNLYDYVNHMSKMERSDLTVCYFDGVPIFSMSILPTINLVSIGFKINYKLGA